MSDAAQPAYYPKITTTIVISKYVWLRLKRAALDEAERDGGQASMSAVIERLVREAVLDT